MSTSSVTKRGQVTIPLAIRRHLKIKPGDRVRFVEHEGRVYISRHDARADGPVVLALDISVLVRVLVAGARLLTFDRRLSRIKGVRRLA
jgi:AbrB family looped-hinge helix DNA binding protein